MKKPFVLMTILCCILSSSSYAIGFVAYPNTPIHKGTGTAFVVTQVPGTYNFTIKIHDKVGNLVKSYSAENFIINNSEHHVLQTWDLLNENLRWVGQATYIVYLKMTNVNTGIKTSAQTNVFVVPGTSEIWLSEQGGTKITDQFGDKIYSFKAQNQTTKKAIIHFKGWDPLNTGDGLSECMSRMPLFKGPASERSNGWDVYFVVWQDAGLSLRVNVDRAIHVINKLNTDYGPYDQCVLIGFSMGGILGRYALAKSETNFAPLPVTKFISVEGEQQGAHINISLQASITHLVNSGSPAVAMGRFLGMMAEVDIYKRLLYSPASKEMLYYHCGLVENYFKSSINDECVFNTSQLEQIRSVADNWHDDFYQEIRSYGYCRGGYPSFCKNYAISMGTAEVTYTADKDKNQHMGTLNAVKKYRIYTDDQDIDQGSFVNIEDNDKYSPKNGYSKKLNFVRLESVLDLQNIDYAKVNGRMVRELTPDELSAHSRFDKIYVRPNGLRQDHQTFWDDFIWEAIHEAINDETPKGSCKPFISNNAVNDLLLD